MAKKQTKYQKGARGQDCKLMMVGCRNIVETVVLCHMPGWINKRIGSGVIGIATKGHDENGVDACNHCHDILDMRMPYYSTEAILHNYKNGVAWTRRDRNQRGIS